MKVILHIEDSPEYIEVTRIRFSKDLPLVKIETAVNVKEGLERLKKDKSRYSLILLDYSFGEGPDGLVFLEEFRQMKVNIPVVFLTSFDEKYIRTRAAELGVEQFMSKYDFLEMANLTDVVSGIIDNNAFPQNGAVPV